MKKLTALLKKLHFFATCIHLAWSLLIVAFSIFGRYSNWNVDLPRMPVVLAVILVGLTGIVLQHRLFAAPKERSAIILYQGFYYGIPAVFSFGKVILCHSLYHFDGFMAGLDELGFVVTFLFVGSVAILGFALFQIIFFVRKKREPKGRSGNSSIWNKAEDVCNLLSFFAIIITLMVLGISYGGESYLHFRHRQTLAEDQAYLEKALSNLQELRGGEFDREELFSEAFYYAKMTEMLALEKTDPLTEKELSDGSFSHIPKEVLEAGRADYLEFAGRYGIVRGVEMLNQELLGNAEDETVSVSSELYVIDTKEQTGVHGCMIVTFDRDWNVIQIRCSELPLIRYTQY